MKLYNISFNNLHRRKAKMVFLLMGLVIGISTVVMIFSITKSMSMDIEERLDKFGANILITPKRTDLPLSYGGISLGTMNYSIKEFDQNSLSAIQEIKNAKNLGVIAPKVLGPVTLKGRDVLLMGADLEKEKILKAFWQFEGQYPDKPHEIAVGSQVATLLNLSVGDQIKLQGKDYLITGRLLETGSAEDNVILTDLAMSQQLLGKEGKITLVEVAAFCRGCPITEMTLQIAEKLPQARIITMKQAVMSKMQSIEIIKSFGLGITILVICISVFLVFITMMGSVNERTREIGIFRAIGFRRAHVMQIILLEAMSVGLLAGFLGFLLGSLIAWLTLPYIIVGGTFAGIDGTIGTTATLFAISLSVIASLYPALKASRLDPSEALRTI